MRTSWKTKNWYAEGALKTSSRHVLKTFLKRLEQQIFAGTALTAAENKIPSVSNLVKKKTDYNTKISEIENKITTDHDHDIFLTY